MDLLTRFAFLAPKILYPQVGSRERVTNNKSAA